MTGVQTPPQSIANRIRQERISAMVQMKKNISPAFDDILAGLDQGAPDRAARAPSQRPSSQTAASRGKKEPESAAHPIEPDKVSTPTNQLRRGLENMAWGWCSSDGADPSASMARYAEQAKLAEAALKVSKAPREMRAPDPEVIPIEPETVPHLPRLFRSLLRKFSWRWRPLHGAVAFEHEVSDVEAVAAAPEPEAAAPPEPPKPETIKTEDEAISAELGLSADLATVDLRRIRRDFAKKNHPDRFEPARRTGAARRMSIANMLIDEQLKQKPKRNAGLP
jgi:hypothetical protein